MSGDTTRFKVSIDQSLTSFLLAAGGATISTGTILGVTNILSVKGNYRYSFHLHRMTSASWGNEGRDEQGK